MTRGGLGLTMGVIALAALNATCSSSKTPTGPGPNNPGAACRTYPTATNVATTSGGVTINAQLTGAFDTNTRKSTVTNSFTPGGLCSTTVTNYDSVADFVNEIGIVPGVTLATSNTTTNTAFCGTGSNSVTFSYDSQRRLTKFTSVGGTTTYTAWDSSGRPTTGSMSSGTTISNVYDNAARTMVQTQVAANGTRTTSTMTFDANGNQTSVVTDAGGVSTTIYTNTATATVCK